MANFSKRWSRHPCNTKTDSSFKSWSLPSWIRARCNAEGSWWWYGIMSRWVASSSLAQWCNHGQDEESSWPSGVKLWRNPKIVSVEGLDRLRCAWRSSLLSTLDTCLHLRAPVESLDFPETGLWKKTFWARPVFFAVVGIRPLRGPGSHIVWNLHQISLAKHPECLVSPSAKRIERSIWPSAHLSIWSNQNWNSVDSFTFFLVLCHRPMYVGGVDFAPLQYTYFWWQLSGSNNIWQKFLATERCATRSPSP